MRKARVYSGVNMGLTAGNIDINVSQNKLYSGVGVASVAEIVTSIGVLASLVAIATGFLWLGRRLGLLEGRLDQLEVRIDTALRLFRSSQELLVDLMAYEGLMRREAYVLARSEIQRLFTITTVNPLTEEEKRRALELLNKDELTLEEAQELYRIADKVVEEYPDRVEAWKLLWYSRFWIGYNLRKMKEAEEKKKTC
jgi:hypothetical protein